MTVVELIEKLQAMPQNMDVCVMVGYNPVKLISEPEQVWDDDSENYVVVL